MPMDHGARPWVLSVILRRRRRRRLSTVPSWGSLTSPRALSVPVLPSACGTRSRLPQRAAERQSVRCDASRGSSKPSRSFGRRAVSSGLPAGQQPYGAPFSKAAPTDSGSPLVAARPRMPHRTMLERHPPHHLAAFKAPCQMAWIEPRGGSTGTCDALERLRESG